MYHYLENHVQLTVTIISGVAKIADSATQSPYVSLTRPLHFP